MFSLVLSDIFTSSMMAVGIFIVLLVNNWVPALLIATLFPLVALIFIDLRKRLLFILGRLGKMFLY